MAIALRHPSYRGPREVLRPLLALVAALILLAGIGLSGGLHLPQPGAADEVSLSASPSPAKTPLYDNRGKWTGY